MTIGMVVEKKPAENAGDPKTTDPVLKAEKLGRIENKEGHNRLISNLFLVSATR